MARNLVLDPLAPNLSEVYPIALQRGFRRAGGHVYRPHCLHCRVCIACRVPADQFRANRSQRRCAARNQDLVDSLEPARFDAELFDLYRRYLSQRHPGGGMDQPTEEDFHRFLMGEWSETKLLCLRDAHGKLLAVAVTDVSRIGLSAVYTFYDPEHSQRGLGIYCVLTQIRLTQRMGLPHLYLGYWIDGHVKMDYKRQYQPIEVLRGHQWVAL